jgi:hypothetical protein
MRYLRNYASHALPVSSLVVASLVGAPVAGQGKVELVTVVPPTGGIVPNRVAAVQVLDENSSEIVFVTRNEGAFCGGGTPASAWKLVLDPDTGDVVSLELKQHLSQIQEIRASLFEASDGTLFTGGGWCGHKPPYVSFDSGETWRPASQGVHPPNSTFSFVEFQGETYAGTGYEPFHAQLYRWLGGGGPDDWEFVLDLDPPRSILDCMAVFEGQLFVGTIIYWFNGCSMCEGSVPVHRSTDGSTFIPTSGIPSCASVMQLVTVDDELLALTSAGCPSTDFDIYRWNTAQEEWEFHTPYSLESTPSYWPRMFRSHAGVLYAYGQAPGDPLPGIYASADIGLTWEQIAEIDDPLASCIDIHEGTMYIGTSHDGGHNVYIYRLSLGVQAYLDIKPGSCPNSFNRNSHGVLPAALVGTASFDVSQVDLSSLLLVRTDGEGGSVAPNFGPPGPHPTIDDVATPFEGEECDCHEAMGDGIADLMLHFRTDDVVANLDLNSFAPGVLVSLTLTGNLLDGEEFEVDDCVRLVPPGTPPGLLAVSSNLPGAWIDLTPPDNAIDQGGFANFVRSYPLTTEVTLTAPSAQLGWVFVGWHVIDLGFSSNDPVADNFDTIIRRQSITVPIEAALEVVEAVYMQVMPPEPGDGPDQGNGDPTHTGRGWTNDSQGTLPAPGGSWDGS